VSLLAAIGLLSLAVTALRAARRSPLGRPLAALCVVLFGWNFATLAHHVFEVSAFGVLDSVFTALSPAALFEFVVRFTGQSGRLRRLRVLVWLAFGALALVTALAFVSKTLGEWTDSQGFSALFLALWAPTVVCELLLLRAHLLRSRDATEKARTRIVLAALAIGATCSTSDIVGGFGLSLPPLGALGTLVAAALLLTSAVRFRLFEENQSARSAAYVGSVIGVSVVAYLTLFRAFAANLAVQAFGVAALTAVVVLVARELGSAYAESRERVTHLATLGRFSAQMAHDLKSPLTALVGAAQVLDGLPAPLDADASVAATRSEFTTMLLAQAVRATSVVDRYDRMARVEVRPTRVRINEVIRSVMRAHAIDEQNMELAASDPECEADRDLVESALENVVRNAVEATSAGGEVRIESRRERNAIVICVRDTGAGMDVRQQERVFDDFFTTKPHGSGLGLAFVRRVLSAHGGGVELESEFGRGTSVELRLPADGQDKS
jgi:signal transduction histidine kinase